MRYTLARLKQKMGDHVGAYEELSRLTALMEDHPEEFPPAETAEVRLRALGALAASGRFSSAASEAAEGARKYPDDERFLVRQGEALILLGKDKEAESIYRGKPDATARLSQAYLAAGARREQEKDTAHAERLLRRAIAIEPTNATALNYLGYMMADQGRNLPEAITLIQRAIAREPDNGAYLDSLGWAHFRKGDMPNARKELERARDASPDEAEIHEHLGELYEAMGLTTEALASWQKAIDLGSDHAARIRERMAETGRKPAGKE
jgi:tetratricopeptide (TPR) repeat protein